jgi:chlorophyll synthase
VELRHLRCPTCGAGWRMLVETWDGKIKCLQCQEVFTVGYGIRYGYPRLPIAKRFKEYLALVRPFTLLAPLMAGLIGTALPILAEGGSWISCWREMIFVAVTLMLLQAVGQITNQIFDIEVDRINKPYRPLARGAISVDEAWSLAWLLAIVALARAFLISTTFGMFAIIVLVMALLYNMPPRLKKNAWLGNLWLGVSRGFIPFVATWSVYGSLSDSFPYVVGIFAFLWVLALNVTKDLPDVEGDRKMGIVTLPVKYGVERTAKIIKAMLVLPFAWITGAVFLVSGAYIVYFGLLPVAVIAAWGLRKSFIVENTIAWGAFYGGLGLIYLLSLGLWLVV